MGLAGGTGVLGADATLHRGWSSSESRGLPGPLNGQHGHPAERCVSDTLGTVLVASTSSRTWAGCTRLCGWHGSAPAAPTKGREGRRRSGVSRDSGVCGSRVRYSALGSEAEVHSLPVGVAHYYGNNLP